MEAGFLEAALDGEIGNEENPDEPRREIVAAEDGLGPAFPERAEIVPQTGVSPEDCCDRSG